MLKPSEVTPLSALFLAALVKEAGFPDGVLNVVPGYGSKAGQALIEHQMVGKVSFTGSTLVGRKIMETASKTNLKRVTLELGGKNPVLVFDDADLDQAVKWATFSALCVIPLYARLFAPTLMPQHSFHSGQVCAAGSRIYVHEKIYNEFLARFVMAANSMRQGDGFREDADQGPLVSQSQLDVCGLYSLYALTNTETHSASFITSSPESKKGRASSQGALGLKGMGSSSSLQFLQTCNRA